MPSDRRDFLSRMALGATTVAGLAALPLELASAIGVGAEAPSSETWDTGWMKRITGRHKAVFDIAEIDGTVGIYRSHFWTRQVREVFGAAPADVSTVIVLRHAAIPLAMRNEYWERYGVGASTKALHPVTGQPSTRNPALLSAERGEIEPRWGELSLDRALANGAIVLACGLAFDNSIVSRVVKADGLTKEEARTRALEFLVPGVVMQPSGVFAALMAQEVGCGYIK